MLYSFICFNYCLGLTQEHTVKSYISIFILINKTMRFVFFQATSSYDSTKIDEKFCKIELLPA